MLVGPIVMRMQRQSWLRQDSFIISLLGGFDQKYHSNCSVFSSIQPLHSSIQKQGKMMKAILELLSCVSCHLCFFSSDLDPALGTFWELRVGALQVILTRSLLKSFACFRNVKVS